MAPTSSSAPGPGDGAGASWALRRPDARAWLFLGVGVLGVSLSAPLTALLTAPALALGVWRNAIGAAALLPVGLTRRSGELARLPRATLLRSALAGVLLAGHFAAWLPSLSLTSVAAATALVCTTPIWTALAARLVGAPVSPRVWIGLTLAVLGTAVIAGVDVTVSTEALLGDLLALAGGIFSAGYVLVGAQVRRQVSTTTYAIVCYLTCAAVLAVAALIFGVPLIGFSTRDWLLILAITVVAQLLGHTVFNKVVKDVGPTVVGLVLLLEVPGAALLAWVLLGQVPPLLALPGLVLVIAGVALVVRDARPDPAVPGSTVVNPDPDRT